MTERVLNGRYRIEALIGRGGMADVYRSYDLSLERDVAVKMLRPDLARDPMFQTRFKREAQSSASLNHPNVVGSTTLVPPRSAKTVGTPRRPTSSWSSSGGHPAAHLARQPRGSITGGH